MNNGGHKRFGRARKNKQTKHWETTKKRRRRGSKKRENQHAHFISSLICTCGSKIKRSQMLLLFLFFLSSPFSFSYMIEHVSYILSQCSREFAAVIRKVICWYCSLWNDLFICTHWIISIYTAERMEEARAHRNPNVCVRREGAREGARRYWAEWNLAIHVHVNHFMSLFVR